MTITLEVLPEEIKGFSIFNINGDYTVVINSVATLDDQRRFYKLEIEKIERGYYVNEILRSDYCNEMTIA